MFSSCFLLGLFNQLVFFNAIRISIKSQECVYKNEAEVMMYGQYCESGGKNGGEYRAVLAEVIHYV